MLIGQQTLMKEINRILPQYPRFSIICGPKGSGKRTVVKEICNLLQMPMHIFGTSVDEVRKAIDLARQRPEKICYVFADADGMSITAKNALLKVTEEPPENAYFILTLLDKGNTLPTILSRGTVFNLDNYSVEELYSYKKYKQYNDAFDDIIKIVCSTTGEVDDLFSCDIPAFYNFAKTIAEKIHIPTSGNIFKISKQIKSKDGDNGFNGVLLFKAVRNLFLQMAIQTKKEQYLNASNDTTKCIRDLMLPTINKIGTVDMWIMDVRKSLRGV